MLRIVIHMISHLKMSQMNMRKANTPQIKDEKTKTTLTKKVICTYHKLKEYCKQILSNKIILCKLYFLFHRYLQNALNSTSLKRLYHKQKRFEQNKSQQQL